MLYNKENHMNNDSELKVLIEEAYSLFSPYAFGDNFEVCYSACCLQQNDGKLIQTTALRQLERRLIYEYLAAAESTEKFALVQQMKYLLPRILELLINREELSINIEINLRKCYFSESDAWQKKEIQFMQSFALIFFEHSALYSYKTYPLDELVIMFHLAGLDIQPLLDKWLNLIPNRSVLMQLVHMLNYDFNHGMYDHAFAEDDLRKQMNQWILNPLNQNIIFHYFIKASDNDTFSESDRELIEKAVYQLYP